MIKTTILLDFKDLKKAINTSESEFQSSLGKKSSLIVLNSEGPVFSSGHDLKEMHSFSKEKQNECFNLCGEIMTMINSYPCIFISELHGIVAAAGLQLLATCDITIASNHAQFSTPGIKIGLFCTTPSVALSRVVSPKRSLEMLFASDNISAQKALEWVLVNQIVECNGEYEEQRKTLREAMIAFANKVSQYRHEYTFGKKAFYTQLKQEDLSKAYCYASEVMTENFHFKDCKERVQAYNKKKKTKFNQ